jgi:beta-glucosidase
LEALLSTGTPVVLVLLCGRPYELGRQADRLAAIVCGFYPGEEGAPALADVLTGRIDAAGRLPLAFPGTGAGQPAPYLGPPLAQAGESSTADPTPLFPFGHGLSYAPARWDDAVLRSPREWPTDGVAVLEVTLHNDATRPSSEVVQVYLHDPVAEVSRPVQQLIAAGRVDLPAGATRTLRIELDADLTSYTGRDGRRRVDAGAVELRVGASSSDIRSRHELHLVGAPRKVGFDRVMEPRLQLLD